MPDLLRSNSTPPNKVRLRKSKPNLVKWQTKTSDNNQCRRPYRHVLIKFFFSPIKIGGKKIRKTKFVVVLGGPQSTNTHNNQPNTHGSDGGWIGQDGNQQKAHGGGYWIVSSAVKLGDKREYNKIDALLIKLFFFLGDLQNWIKPFIGALNQPIVKRFPGVGS